MAVRIQLLCPKMGEQYGHLEEEIMVRKTNIFIVIFVLFHLPHSLSTPCRWLWGFFCCLVTVQEKDFSKISIQYLKFNCKIIDFKKELSKRIWVSQSRKLNECVNNSGKNAWLLPFK